MPTYDPVTEAYAKPNPSTRRELGIADARRGTPPLSNDRDYAHGYEIGARMSRPKGAAPEPAPEPSARPLPRGFPLPPASEVVDADTTVRRRMEAIGWVLNVSEDTCETFWIKSDPATGRVVAYPEDRRVWERDLERCQAEYGYDEGRSAYL